MIMASHSMNVTITDNQKLQSTSHPAAQQLLPYNSSASQPAAHQVFPTIHQPDNSQALLVIHFRDAASPSTLYIEQPPTAEDHLQGIDINDLFGDLV